MRWLLLAVLVLVPAALAAQGAAQASNPPVPRGPAGDAGKPAWIETLPEAAGRLYALGTAQLGGNEGEAIARASDRARLEVVTRLRATVQGRTSVTTRTSESRREGAKAVGAGERQVRDEVSVGAQAEDLPGLVVERTHTDRRARTVYALAYLDLALAQGGLAARLDQARAVRLRVGDELSRKARWRLRKLQEELNRIDESIALLAATGSGGDLRPALQAERTALDQGLRRLEGQPLPAMELAKTTMGLRTNVDFPPGIQAYLEAQIVECGLLYRNLSPDLVLELTFAGGSRGAEFIFADADPYVGLSYRTEAKMSILEGQGLALTRPVPLQLSQADSPEGMVNQFRRLFERRLPKLVAEALAELQ
jgi:hypothetical protein